MWRNATYNHLKSNTFQIGTFGTGVTARPFRTIKEVHETLYHFHKPKDEAEANLWMRRALVTYNNGDHRSEPHSRIEDWLKHLPASGVRAMCSWQRFCAFAREPERRGVAGDATVSVEGVSYEVEPELAGETVTLWWGLFDQELFVEFEGKRFGPYQPSRGAVPLYRYRKYQKSRAEERLDKVVQLADQLGLPRAVVTGGDRPLPSLPPAAAPMQVRRAPFPEPEADAAFATSLAARLAISVQLSRPLGSLPEPDRAYPYHRPRSGRARGHFVRSILQPAGCSVGRVFRLRIEGDERVGGGSMDGVDHRFEQL